MTLGQRIQKLRKQAGLSQEALGEALGVSRQAVSKWEGDNGIPELDTLIAMSRLFGVTLGQLLGVEEPAPAEEASAPAMDEEKIEAVLRRYVEESRAHKPPEKNTTGAWVTAICCILVSVSIAIAAVNYVQGVERSVNALWSNVSDIEDIVTNVRNQVGGLSDEMRDILEEQNNPVRSYEYRVADIDAVEGKVTLEFAATLKIWTPGTQAQFVLNWNADKETAEQAASDWVDGPDFTALIVLPAEQQTELMIRFKQPDGTIQEQTVEKISTNIQDVEFRLGSTLDSLLDIDVSTDGTSINRHGTGSAIIDGATDLVWPERVTYTATVNGELWHQGELNMGQHSSLWIDPQGPRLLTMAQGDELLMTLSITDNLGREHIFKWLCGPTESGWHWEWLP